MVDSDCHLDMVGASYGETSEYEEELVWQEKVTAALICQKAGKYMPKPSNSLVFLLLFPYLIVMVCKLCVQGLRHLEEDLSVIPLGKPKLTDLFTDDEGNLEW